MTPSLPRMSSPVGRRLSSSLLVLILLGVWPRTVAAQDFNETESQIDQYLFSGATQASFEKSQKEKGQARMRLLDRLLTLNEEQKEKVELAIDLDIANFVQDVDVVREKVRGLSPNNNDEWQKFWEQVSPLYQRVQAGLFDSHSLYHKVSETILDDEQLAKLREQEEANQALLIEQSAYEAVAHLSSLMPLLAEHQQQIVDLMVENAKGKQLQFDGNNQEQYLKWALIGSLAMDKLPSSLDKSQTTFLKKYSENYRAYGRRLK